MIDAIRQAIELIRELFFDGFLALVAVAVAAPLLGVLLVLRRMPLLGLAIPQMAGCGQAATYFGFALLAVADPMHPEEPGTLLQLAGSLAGVVLGLLVLVVLTRDRRFVGVHAGIVFLAAIALRELLYLESPYHKIFEESIHQGRLLTVDASGRNGVVACCAVVMLLGVVFWRRLWVCAFDADQARLLGLSARRQLAFTLLLLGGLCAFCVPVVGPEVVLTLLLAPAAILRGVTPSLAAFAPLSVIAGVLGSVAAFVLSCVEAVDWPPGPTLVLCVVASSAAVAGIALLVRWVTAWRHAVSA